MGGGSPSAIKRSDSGYFDFNSADWISAQYSTQTLTLQGYRDNIEVYSSIATITSSSVLHLELNWEQIDELTMVTNRPTGASGFQYGMDNFVYNEMPSVPIPSTISLLCLGLLSLVGVNRRKK